MIPAIDEYNLLRADEVAKILRLSEPRIYQLAKTGMIPSFRIGKSVRFQESDVRKFLRSRRLVAQVV